MMMSLPPDVQAESERERRGERVGKRQSTGGDLPVITDSQVFKKDEVKVPEDQSIIARECKLMFLEIYIYNVHSIFYSDRSCYTRVGSCYGESSNVFLNQGNMRYECHCWAKSLKVSELHFCHSQAWLLYTSTSTSVRGSCCRSPAV